MSRACLWTHAEGVPFDDLLAWMDQAADRVRAQSVDGLIFTGSVAPVVSYTKWESPRLLVDEEALAGQDIAIRGLDRAGGSYYLGPGHVLAYPVLRMSVFELDPLGLTWTLEETALRALASLGVRTERHGDLDGLWTATGRVARVGSSIRHEVSRFGLTVNLQPAPEQERLIMRCSGDCEMDSITEHVSPAPSVEDVASVLIDELSVLLGATVRFTDWAEQWADA